MTVLTVHAPAKINLGLEILGKRADGYHEIRTVMCAISLHDTLTFEPVIGNHDQLLTIGNDTGVGADDNLVIKALRAVRACGADLPPQRVTLDKRIPSPSGLGGASSDAAATLIAFEPALRAAGCDPTGIGASLGSDVPFFLNGPVALASGRGETLQPLRPPPSDAWVVLVTPHVTIPAKTQTMYAAIAPSSWSTGEAIDEIARRLPTLPRSAPPNTFERALATAFPELMAGRSWLREAGAPWAALSGAGPTWYAIVANHERAESIAVGVEGHGAAVNLARLGVERDEDGAS